MLPPYHLSHLTKRSISPNLMTKEMSIFRPNRKSRHDQIPLILLVTLGNLSVRNQVVPQWNVYPKHWMLGEVPELVIWMGLSGLGSACGLPLLCSFFIIIEAFCSTNLSRLPITSDPLTAQSCHCMLILEKTWSQIRARASSVVDRSPSLRNLLYHNPLAFGGFR